VRTPFDAADESRDMSPFIAEVDVMGLYQPDIAAVASRTTACATRIDD
jgi:hypothetical protein